MCDASVYQCSKCNPHSNKSYYTDERLCPYIVMRPMYSIESSVMYMKLVRSTDRRHMATTYIW